MAFSMKDNHKIKECEDCGEMYCVSCSDADETDKYCSQKCQDEAFQDNNWINFPRRSADSGVRA
jgi:hypothetical protein